MLVMGKIAPQSSASKSTKSSNAHVNSTISIDIHNLSTKLFEIRNEKKNALKKYKINKQNMHFSFHGFFMISYNSITRTVI